MVKVFESDNVIPFPARLDRPTVDRTRERSDGTSAYCLHRAVSINVNAREVTCQGCKASLDPIRVIEQIANNEITLWNLGEAHRKLADKVFELKAEEKRIKARIRTAKKKLPHPDPTK